MSRRVFAAALVLFAGITPVCLAQDAPPPAVEQAAPAAGPVMEPDSASPEAAASELIEGAEPVEGGEPGGESVFVLPRDLSPWGMFAAADPIVKAVIVGLAFASLAVWTVFFVKTFELARARAGARRALAVIASAQSIEAASRALGGRSDPCALMVRSAEEEMRLSSGALAHAGPDGLRERVAVQLSRIEARAGRALTRGTGILATIGSTAPFVGLFGTVWGIMNSFIAISEAHTTNLAVVAPGIAEALLATAIGLVAAIPAVVFYNLFARAAAGYRHLLADGGAGVERLLSRDLDFGRLAAGAE